MFMHCENIFCVYWAAEGCVLEEISLDMQGKCESCLYIPFPEEELEKKRQAYLKQENDLTKNTP